jgi:hypothetical protein
MFHGIGFDVLFLFLFSWESVSGREEELGGKERCHFITLCASVQPFFL